VSLYAGKVYNLNTVVVLEAILTSGHRTP
jgi:hypothetical protein